MGFFRSTQPEKKNLLLAEPNQHQALFLQYYGLDKEPEELPGGKDILPISLWLGKFVNREAAVVTQITEENWKGTIYFVGIAEQSVYDETRLRQEDPTEYAVSTATTPIPDNSRTDAVKCLMGLLRYPPMLETSPRDIYVLGYQAGNQL